MQIEGGGVKQCLLLMKRVHQQRKVQPRGGSEAACCRNFGHASQITKKISLPVVCDLLFDLVTEVESSCYCIKQ